MKATKDLILAGAAPEPFLVPALDAEVLIRRLHATEAEEVQAVQVAGMSVTGGLPTRQRPTALRSPESQAGISLDLSGSIVGNHKANQLAAHYGLVDPAMTLSEVQKTDVDIVEQIGEEVIRRSGLSKAAAIRDFRGLEGGPDDAGAPAGGDTAGEDAG